MKEAYREEPLPFEQFISLMREAKERIMAGIVEKVELYTGLECTLLGDLLSLGATKVEVLESQAEHEIKLTFVSRRIDRRAGEIGLGFYYNSEPEVHSLTLFNELTSYGRLKEYIYSTPSSSARFLLKELAEENFIELLVDELFFQLAWNIPELNYHMMKCSSPDFTRRLLKEIKVRRFNELFQERGFTVKGGEIYCALHRLNRLPEEERLLTVRGDYDIACYARYSEERGCFYRVDSEEEIKPVHFWRYVESSEMRELLEREGLEEFDRYLLLADRSKQ